MAKINIIFIIVFILITSGCASTRVIESARDRINELEGLNEAGTARNLELAELLESERSGNEAIRIIVESQKSELDDYFQSAKNRTESQKRIAEGIGDIFVDGETELEGVIRRYYLLRAYFESLEVLE